jgi:hypothetical protein
MRVFALYGSERSSAEIDETKTYLVAAATEIEACRCVPDCFRINSVFALKGIEASILAPGAVAWSPGLLQGLLT